MIIVSQANIIKTDSEAIVSPTNGLFINNKGASGSILSAAGNITKNEIEIYKKKQLSIKEGDFYKTSGGKLIKNGVKIIYHAVINMTPNSNTSIYSINIVMNRILDSAIKNKIKSIAFTGLGTGCCCLNKKIVATNMVSIAQKYCGLLTINMIDLDKQMVKDFNECLFKD